MSGPILLVVLAVLGFFLWKYRAGIANAWANRPARAPRQPRAQNQPHWAWTVLLIGAALAVLYWGVYSSELSNLSAASASRWAWAHVVPLVLLGGILAAIIELNASSLGAAKNILLQTLVWGAAALFIGFWVVGWFTPSSASDASPQVAAAAKHSNAPALLRLGPGEKSAKIPVPQHMHVVARGDNFRWHLVYEDGHEVTFVPGEATPAMSSMAMPFIYFENLRKEDPNAIVYHYEK